MKLNFFALLFLVFPVLMVSQTRYVDSVLKKISKNTYNYSIKNLDTLKLDFYEPIEDSLIAKPLFLYVHGGGFSSGSRNDLGTVKMLESIAKKGYAVASIDYRLLPKDVIFGCDYKGAEKIKTFSKAAEDVIDALTFLVNYKDDFYIDQTKIILSGTSAGAESILNLVYNKDELVLPNYEKYKHIKISAVVSISGAVLNPSLITTSNSVPGVFFHGVIDKVVPYNEASHRSCKATDKGYLPLYGSKKITESISSFNTSNILISYKDKGHDLSKIPSADFFDITFKFIKKVVIDNEFYQAQITQ